MDEKNFFAKLAGVPDGKFSGYSQQQQQQQQQKKNGNFDKEANIKGKVRDEKKREVEEAFNKKSGVDLKVDKDDEEEREINIKSEVKEEDKRNETEEIYDGPEGELAVDAYSIDSYFIIEAPIAGVRGEDVDVAITTDTVTIRGKRIKEEREKDRNYLYSECFWGRFARTVNLPQDIDVEKAQASFKNGILKLSLPKINRSKEKKLRVRFE